MFAQDFSGRATYKTHRKSSFELDSTTMATNPGIQKSTGGSNEKNVSEDIYIRLYQVRIYV